jgi:thymidylate synthase
MLKRILKSNKVINNYEHEENQYINLINDVLINDEIYIGRNGNTYSIFGTIMQFSLENNKIPFLTTKKLAWKTCLKELLFFINGNTNNNILNNQGVHIWDGNSDPDYLKTRGLDYVDGELGPIYGFQWRHFNANYIDCNADYTNSGIDQLQYIIDCLKDPIQRKSRRLILTAWNPCQLDKMALPPCHILCQFNVSGENKLSCHLYQRSGDIGLGVPFNIASYSMLTYIIAKHCDLVPYEFIYSLGNAHIYDDHVSGLKELMARKPFEFPNFEVINKHNSIDDYNVNDFKLTNYNYHNTINLNMRK